LNDLLGQSKSIKQALLLVLSKELADLGEHTKSLLLSQTTTSKLAKLLLEWYLESEVVDAGLVRIDKEFSHEQIAQMIGSSRETVTRLLVAFRKQQIIRITAARILIVQPAVLESLAFGSKQKPDTRLK
jgi:CRP/FNR family transcriptional regulator